MDLQPSPPEDGVIGIPASTSVAETSMLPVSPMDQNADGSVGVDVTNAAVVSEGPEEHRVPVADENDNETPQSDSMDEKQQPGATFPKQVGNAWGTAKAPTSSSSSQTVDSPTSNTKKRPNGTILSGDSTPDAAIDGNISSKPKFADIMAEQASEKAATKVSFGITEDVYVEGEEERMMRLAIEASLQDHQDGTQGFTSHAKKMPPPALKNSHGTFSGATDSQQVSFSNNNIAHGDNDDMDDDMRMAIALSLQEAEGGAKVGSFGNDTVEDNDDRKPAALTKEETKLSAMEDDAKPAAVENTTTLHGNTQMDTQSSDALLPAAASASSAAAASAASAAAAACGLPTDESEKLAQALYEAELAEYNTSQSASDAAEAASLQLALKLQQEEDARHSLQQDAEAARLKREEMCHGGGGGNVGVRTVGRDEFFALKTHEEKGMGKLLASNGYGDAGMIHDETEDYHNDYLDEEDHAGIRMNSQSSSSSWKRLDRDTFVGPNNEVRTKHDTELKHRANAVNLLGSHGAKLKDAQSKSALVSDRAFNAFKRAESRQSGFKKGVARQAHGRAENMNAGKTRGGAMDGNVRLQISAAINSGLIDNCNGVVKEGKEAMVYHADGGWKGRQIGEEAPDTRSDEATGSDGYDVAVKVFKRIAEFKGRGCYVDGDPRYHKQKFKTNDQREQVVLWAEKEYRNLIRAHRAGVSCPKPLDQKENILFMRFLGDGGWPSPQLKEIDIKKGSDKWTTFYAQTLVAIRRLYHCARLIHADLSEYNLLVCPHWQASHGRMSSPDNRTVDDETLQVVLIDFGQAVEVGHPSAATWLRRDLSTVQEFFVRQGIKTLSIEEAEAFVTDPFEEATDAVEDASDEAELKESSESREEITWRHSKKGWDDAKEMEALLEKLKGC